MSRFEIRTIDNIPDLKVITPFYVEDDRGYFLKAYEKDVFAGFGLSGTIHEDFETYSKKGVIRGLHFQTAAPQTKLVRVLQGKIFDVAVDLRSGSATLGKWHAEILSSENHSGYYIPEGFGHGFLVLSEFAVVQYKCCGKFDAQHDTGIKWNDDFLSIEWPLDLIGGKENITISSRDADLQTYEEYISNPIG